VEKVLDDPSLERRWWGPRREGWGLYAGPETMLADYTAGKLEVEFNTPGCRLTTLTKEGSYR
jgi:hypothetical protein